MEGFIIYILKSALCLSIFLVIYTLFLRPTTFFKFNRVFFILGILSSLIIPAIHYTYDVFIPAVTNIVSTIENSESNLIIQEEAINIWHTCFVIYIVGTAILIIRNLISYLKLNKLIKNGLKSDSKKAKVIENINIKSPFTILNYILINSINLSNIEKDLILKHEMTHINQKHWADLLCSECMLLFQWFNPLAWVYVKFLKENHEFLADKAVIDSGISPAVYQAVLINQRFQGQVFSFSNSFNYSNPLNRLSMIKKAKSSPWKRLCALFTIPIFGLFIWASAEPNYIVIQETLEEFSIDTTTEKTATSNAYYPLAINKDSASTKLQGRITKIKENKNGNDNSHLKLNLKILSAKTIGKTDTIVGFKNINIYNNENSPLIYIDGLKSDYKRMNDINPNEIESINVLKDQNATSIYGNEAKNGVILITSKKYADKNTNVRAHDLILQSTKEKTKTLNITSPNPPLLIVDDKEEPYENMRHLKSSNIESITILKDKTAIEAFGEKGKYGVIIITLKK